MGTEPEIENANNVAAQLAIIKNAFKESETSPTCCFKYDANHNLLCDVIGPLNAEQFMKECRNCQSTIKNTLAHLQTN